MYSGSVCAPEGVMALAHTDTTLCALRFSLRVDVFQILRAAIHHRCAPFSSFRQSDEWHRGFAAAVSAQYADQRGHTLSVCGTVRPIWRCFLRRNLLKWC